MKEPGTTNRSKTHCPKGHPYKGSNLIIRKRSDGERRVCRKCASASARAYYWSKVKKNHPRGRGRPREHGEEG